MQQLRNLNLCIVHGILPTEKSESGKKYLVSKLKKRKGQR